MMKIYPSITTWPAKHWQKMIGEVKKRKITEVSVFLTGLDFKERQKFYQLLKTASVKRIPHLHVRHDMTGPELDFFYDNYQTRQFNIHSEFAGNFRRYRHYRNCFLIEVIMEFNTDLLNQVRGYCTDIAHIQDRRNNFIRSGLKIKTDQLIADGRLPEASHLSGLHKNGNSIHTISRLSDFNYLKKVPKEYFGKIVSLEVDNIIQEQLKYINYLNKIL